MATPPVLDGARLLSWARRSAAELDRRRMEINQLNVFPVPDSDTGSNMAHTMAAAVSEASDLAEEATAEQVAGALAVGSMRGARGNSGVVLSQVLRGVAQTVDGNDMTGQVVADALDSAVGFVDSAISNPVEGTVLTVLRAAALAAGRVQPADLEQVATAARDAARQALAETPSQLKELKEAGVVDAGGMGLVILLDALVAVITGAESKGTEDSVPTIGEHHHGSQANVEVMFYFEGPVDAVEQRFLELGGDSLIIARGSETTGTVHVHSREPGKLIEEAFALGIVSDLRLEVLPDNPSVLEKRPQRIVIAIVPEGSLSQLFSEAGAVTLAPGSDDAATRAAVMRTIAEFNAREMVLLPNGLIGRNAVTDIKELLAGTDQSIAVPAADSLVAGIAALAVFDDVQDLDVVADTMSETAAEVRTAVVEAGEKADELEEIFAQLLDGGGELITVLYNPTVIAEPPAAELSSTLGVEVMVYPADGLSAAAEIGVE